MRRAAGVALAAVLLCLPASAKEKKMPLPEWAEAASKTPTPDYAKGAGSVVLYDEYMETIDGQGRATEREREAIRILEPQDRGQGCGVSYDVDEKVNSFHVWTLGADGKTYQAMDEDFTDQGDTSDSVMLSSEKRRVAHPPAADVGATIFCDSEELMAPWRQEKLWWVQSSTPVVFQALEVDLPAGSGFASSWHQTSPVKPVEVSPNHWRWEVRDMHRLDLRGVKSRPDSAALEARAHVMWNETAVKGDLDARWQAIGKWTDDLEAHRPDPSPEIIAKAQELTAGSKDFFDKLTAVSEYIQKNVKYFIIERGIGGFQAHYASDIYRRHYGDCKDKATLVISMLQAAGLKAHYVSVDHRRGFIDRETPSMYGDHMITAIEVPAEVKDPRLKAVATLKNGTLVLFFDPTDERTPVGNLPSELQGSFGLVLDGAQSQLLALPMLAPEDNGTEQKGSFKLTADGLLTGTVDTQHIGPEGADFRYFLKQTEDKERRQYWEKYLARDLSGVTLTDFRFTQPDSLQKPMQFHYEIKVPSYSHQAGPLLLVRARVVGQDALPYDDKSRTVPIDLNATGRWHDSFDIELPAGYKVDELPDPVSVDAGFASYKASVVVEGNKLHYERECQVRQLQLPATKMAEFRRFEQTILYDEEGTVVLKKQ